MFEIAIFCLESKLSRVTCRVYVTYIVYRYTYFDEKNIVSHESQVKKLLAVASRLGRSESNTLAGCLNIKTGRKGRDKGFFNNSSVAHTRTLYMCPCIDTFLFSLYNVYKAKNEKNVPFLFLYYIYSLFFQLSLLYSFCSSKRIGRNNTRCTRIVWHNNNSGRIHHTMPTGSGTQT